MGQMDGPVYGFKPYYIFRFIKEAHTKIITLSLDLFCNWNIEVIFISACQLFFSFSSLLHFIVLWQKTKCFCSSLWQIHRKANKFYQCSKWITNLNFEATVKRSLLYQRKSNIKEFCYQKQRVCYYFKFFRLQAKSRNKVFLSKCTFELLSRKKMTISDI